MVQITPFMLQGIRQIVRFPLKFIEQAIHLLYTFFKSMTLVQRVVSEGVFDGLDMLF